MATKKKFTATFYSEGTTKGGKLRLGDSKDNPGDMVGALYLPSGTPDEGVYKVTVEKVED
jgi:hypothetical protein